MILLKPKTGFEYFFRYFYWMPQTTDKIHNVKVAVDIFSGYNTQNAGIVFDWRRAVHCKFHAVNFDCGWLGSFENAGS